MASGIRQSKFKHVFGKPLKRDEGYDCLPITRSTHDTAFCAINPKYLAVIIESAGGGAFAVIPIAQTGRQTTNLPLVSGHTAAVLDIQWCPHDYDVIASSSEDCTVRVWRIPEGGIGNDHLCEALVTLLGHQRRVNCIIWHPTARSVIASSGGDNMTILWNVETQTQLMSVEFPNLATSMSFNMNGSKLALCSKDGVTRVMDPRTGNVLQSGTCHEGKKPQQCVFLSDGRILTAGFSKMSERQLALWNSDNLSEAEWKEELDITNGVLFLFYDPDTELIYVCGKGDSTVRYFEYSAEEGKVYYLSRYDSTDPQRGFNFMPKLGLNTQINEIGRMYKLQNKNYCEVIPFTVPRRSGLFQEDLYPNTAAPVAALTADEWFAGTNKDPILVAIKETTNGSAAAATYSRPATVLINPQSTKDQPVSKKPSISDSRHSSQLGSGDSSEIAQLTRTVEKLTKTIKSLENRVRELEEKAETETSSSDTQS